MILHTTSLTIINTAYPEILVHGNYLYLTFQTGWPLTIVPYELSAEYIIDKLSAYSI